MRILFLTNNKISESLINWLRKEADEEVIVINEKISKEMIEFHKPDLIISYNYRFIIKKDVLSFISNRIINLHISLLPWNRGAHPNLWSFLDSTPKGVTIHLIDEHIDTGNILVQKEVIFDEKNEALVSSYQKLHKEIQEMFMDNWDGIKNFKITPRPQPAGGSIHYIRDFEKIKSLIEADGWDISICELKNRYRKLREKNGNNKDRT